MRRTLKHKKSGITLLETAMMMAVFLVVLVGAVDITQIIRAHSAIKEAATASLRCLTPLDGACIDIASIENQTEIFKVYQTNGQTERYINQYHYDGGTSELVGGLFVYSGGTATILDRAFSPSYRYNAVSNRYSADGLVKTVTRRIPFVSASNVASREPIFTIRNGSSSAPALTPIFSRNLNTTLIFNAESDPLVRTRSRTTMTIPFRIPRPSIIAEAPFSRCLTQSGGTFIEGCDAINRQLTASGNIVLFLQGTSRGINGATPRGAHVDISLQFGERIISLGGRDFTQSSNNNYATLIPRGADTNYVDREILAAFPAESNNHQNVSVPYDTDINLKIALRPDWKSENRDVTWTAERLSIFSSNYTLTSEAAPCLTKLTKQDIDSDSCLAANNLTAYGLKNIEISKSDSISQDIGCFISEDEAQTNSDITDPNIVLEKTAVTCPERSFQSTCPENFGALNDEEANSACPFNASGAVMTVEAVNEPRWSEKTIQLSLEPFNAQPKTCLNNEPVLTEHLKKYRKITFDSRTVGNGSVLADIPLELQNKTLSELRLLPEFNCEHFEIQSGETLSDRNIPFFNSPQPDLGCNWQAQVINAASLPASVEISPTRAVFNSEKVLTNVEPDSCTQFEERPLKDSTKIYLGEYSKDQIPKNCTGKCILEFARYESRKTESPSLDFDAAKNTAKAQAAVIAQNTEKFQIEFTEESKVITASASTTVPLLLKREPYTVRYQESALRE